jgi:hypothetical protein
MLFSHASYARPGNYKRAEPGGDTHVGSRREASSQNFTTTKWAVLLQKSGKNNPFLCKINKNSIKLIQFILIFC